MEETVHIALAFCDPSGTYARHAAVTAASVFANTACGVCCHIIHDDTLTDSNRRNLSELAAKYGQETDFINVGSMFDAQNIDVSKLTIDGARGTLFRLMIPDVIPVDKIIYLDCDIVSTLDIKELWDVSLNGRAVGAARDVWSLDYLAGRPLPWRLDKAWEIMGVARGEYFNAGVLLMNLKKLRDEYNFLGKVEAFYKEYKKCITLADQDCLNHIFANDKILIDERFNKIDASGVKSEEDLSGFIWHMAGGAAKPWTTCSRPLVDDLYWRYLTLTPYCPDEKTLIRLMMRDLSSGAFTHLHSSDCVKRLKKQTADNIFRGHIWTLPHIFMKKIARGSK